MKLQVKKRMEYILTSV